MTVIRAVPERAAFVSYLTARLPGAVVVWDRTRNALDTFVEACRAAGRAGALHVEDDVMLTAGFPAKAGGVIAGRPDSVVQFFSMRAADLTAGSREEPGRTFLMGQCFYLPPGVSAEVAAFAAGWGRRDEHPTGLDLMVADYLKETRRRYWLSVPSLVQHRSGRSAIDPRRSSARQSPTFTDPDE